MTLLTLMNDLQHSSTVNIVFTKFENVILFSESLLHQWVVKHIIIANNWLEVIFISKKTQQ